MIKPNELHDLKLDKDQQLAVYYRGVWCGRFKKGVIPTSDEIERKISDNGFYCCEVACNYDWAVGLKIMDDQEVKLVKDIEIPEGYILVPIEPSYEQLDALKNSCVLLQKAGISDLEAWGAYKAMVVNYAKS